MNRCFLLGRQPRFSVCHTAKSSIRRMPQTPSTQLREEKTVNENGVDIARPLVSITVPTYNNQETIVQCVESLVSQQYRPLEVVVVDDGSTDGTSGLAKNLTQRFENIRLVQTEHFGASHARNVGIRESVGEILLFADADAMYSSDYLTKGLQIILADPGIGGVCVTGTIWIRKNTFISRGIALEYEMKQRFLSDGKWEPYFAFLYTRESLVKAGGFDEELFQGEDKDLFQRVKAAGYRIGLVQGFNWFHQYPQDLRSLLSRSYRGGKQRVIYIVKKRMYGELIMRTAGLWALVALLVISPILTQSLLAIGFVLVLAYSYKVFLSLANGWGKGRFSDILLLPFVSAIRYLTTATGYTKGSIVYLLRRVRRLDTGWYDL